MKKKTGFTLIELMVVISIISILSAILTPTVTQLLARARDASKKADFSAISTALYMFVDDHGRMPNNNGTAGQGSCTTPTAESPAPNDGYDASMQELVNGAYLKEIPRPVNDAYCYFNYGAGNNMGAMIVANLETETSTTGMKGSCRPFAVGTNWCDLNNDGAYCIRNPH